MKINESTADTPELVENCWKWDFQCPATLDKFSRTNNDVLSFFFFSFFFFSFIFFFFSFSFCKKPCIFHQLVLMFVSRALTTVTYAKRTFIMFTTSMSLRKGYEKREDREEGVEEREAHLYQVQQKQCVAIDFEQNISKARQEEKAHTQLRGRACF